VGGTARGVVISDSNATFDFDAASEVKEFDSTDFEVDGGAGTITFAGDVINTTVNSVNDTSGRSVHIHDVTGGSVTFTAASSIQDDNEGLLVEDNSGGVISFLGTNDFDTDANDAITVQNNTGNVDVVFNNLDIDTTSGEGVVIAGNAASVSVNINGVDVNTTTGNAFSATGGGDLTVSGNNNVIQTTTGTGLRIEGMNIVGGATFESVTVAGAVNGIVLRDLTGSQVTVGEAGGADNSGGTLDTTGDAIILENVANVDLINMQIVDANTIGVNIDHTSATNMDVTLTNLNLDSSGGLGIDVDHTSANLFNLRLNESEISEQVDMDISGSGQFQLLVDNTEVTTGGTDVAFDLAFSGGAADGDVTIRNTSTFTAVDAEAFIMTIDGAGKSVELNIDNNAFVNTSNTDRTAEILASGGATLNANVVNNSFTNFGAAEDLLIESDEPATVVNLNIINNGPPGADLRLREAAGDFNVVDLADADANNPGNIIFEPNMAAFDDIPGPVEMPTVP
jgi:hypothetical protein